VVNAGPLTGLRLIELSSLLAGPFAGRLLGDLGAEVIKVEPPGKPDPLRDMLSSGWDEKGDFFYSMEILYGGIPGRPIGDGMDGHSWWPLFENIPTEYLEAYYTLRIDGYTTITDSGGAGLHRGGNGVEKRYVYLEPGDMLVFRAAGGGGWKDRLERPVAAIERDVAFGLVSREKALRSYDVMLGEDGKADLAATEAERARQAAERGEPLAFDFGPPLEQVLANCKAETGLEPPRPAKPLRWSPLEDGAEALAKVHAAAARGA